MFEFIAAFFISSAVLPANQEQFRREILDHNADCSTCQGVCLVCEGKENLVSLDRCPQHQQCVSCLSKHINTQLDRGCLPGCTQARCRTKISYGTVLKLLDGQVNKKEAIRTFVRLAIDARHDFRCCPVNKTTLAKSLDNDWLQYCEGCEKIHCFICGSSHKKTSSCLETSPELFASLISAYRSLRIANPRLEWRLCPYCGTVAEKKDGCLEIMCGQNYYYTHPEFGEGLGCARVFAWDKARLLAPDGNQSPPF